MSRRIARLVCIAALGLVPGLSASAAPLASASLSFVLGTLPPTTFVATGASGSATSNLSASLASGTAFNGSFTTPAPTSAAPITQLQVLLTGNGAGAFAGATPAAVGGTAVFNGVANVIGFSGVILLGVPLQIGSPGIVTASTSGVNITAIFADWTAGTAVVTGLTLTASTATLMGSNALSAAGQGTLVLVTPMKLLSSFGSPIAAFGILTLTYVPEPGTLLLLGLGVAGLAVCGRRRL